MSADNLIAEILARYGENPRDATWKVQGTTVIYHKALERIAAQAKIQFERPEVIRSERDEAVILVIGAIGSDKDYREEWSIGEAVITDGTRPGNYRVSGKQAAYPYAMAEKRAKDRVILKLIGLHGLLYSEEEADEFKEVRRPQASVTVGTADDLISELAAAATQADLDATKAMPAFKKAFATLSEDDKARVIRAGTDRRNELAEAA